MVEGVFAARDLLESVHKRLLIATRGFPTIVTLMEGGGRGQQQRQQQKRQKQQA